MRKIVIVGGGAAGLQVATRLGRRLGKRGLAEVILIDRSPTHLWKPLLHEVAAGRLEPVVHHTSFALQAERHRFRFVQGELQAVDRSNRTISIALSGTGDGENGQVQSIAYDKLVLAVGGVTQYFGVPGAREHALTLDSVSSAEEVRERVFTALRRRTALADTQQQAQSAKMRVAIVGAGATGVQLAAQLRRTSRVLNRYGIHRLDPVAGVDICLIEASPAVLPGMGTRIAARVGEQLASLNIRVQCNAKVTSVSQDGLTVAGQPPMPTDIVIWAAGVAAPALLGTFQLPVNAKGQIRVLPTLQCVVDEHIYAIGDCASCRLRDLEAELPTRAQVAYQQALYLAKALPQHLAGKSAAGFRYRDHGSLVALAGSSTIAKLAATPGKDDGWHVEGRLAALLHHAIYRRHVINIHGWLRALGMTLAQGLERLLAAGSRLH
ncbi:NAD(P)/FAD-dependent oxidoreductase [Cupriavidus sp. 2TAF22]|uniref:NAD(P)/FAD-dependent oxidoreductase n=1 Tax=unclassified Cupriavidus TaxID=2640874 RepID=UPI003F8E88CE